MPEKEFTIEELTELREAAKKAFDDLDKQFQKKKQEEEDKRQEKLRLQKETRRKEVDDAFDKYIKLIKAYEKDYGPYILSRNFINEFPWNLFWN